MPTEKQKIESAIREFSKLMNERMQKKRRNGFRGWQDEELIRSIENRLQSKVIDVILGEAYPDDFVDIANFSMMLHAFNATSDNALEEG